MKSRFLILFCAASLLAACSAGGSVDTGTSNTTTIRPGVGSLFVYHSVAWDTLGNISDDHYDTEVIFKSGFSYQGKDNVVAVSYKYDTALKYAIYFNYEPNGDIDDYYSIAPPFRWRTYPIASHDSAVSGYFKFSFVKDSSLVEASRTMQSADISLGDTSAGYNPVHEDYWVARSLGKMVRIVTTYSRPYFQNYSRFEYHLVSYDLK